MAAGKDERRLTVKTQTLKINSHTLKITNADRVLFPEDGITKGEFVDYYRRISGAMVPHLKGRPIIMFRFHGDIRGEGYYQQSIPSRAPGWVTRATVKKAGGTTTHIVCDNAASLVYLANLNCVTPHVWLSRRDRVDNPDQIIFDLDPPGDNFETVREGAGYLKNILDELGLVSYLKTTGSRGLHVVIPVSRLENFETTRSFAKGVAEIMTRREPRKYTTEQRKEKRQGRLFIDTLRNAYAHSAVAAYAVRAIKGAPVAAPLLWEELNEPGLTAQTYNIRNIFKRLERTGEPWKEIGRHPQSLNKARRRLEEMLIRD